MSFNLYLNFHPNFSREKMREVLPELSANILKISDKYLGFSYDEPDLDYFILAGTEELGRFRIRIGMCELTFWYGEDEAVLSMSGWNFAPGFDSLSEQMRRERYKAYLKLIVLLMDYAKDDCLVGYTNDHSNHSSVIPPECLDSISFIVARGNKYRPLLRANLEYRFRRNPYWRFDGCPIWRQGPPSDVAHKFLPNLSDKKIDALLKKTADVFEKRKGITLISLFDMGKKHDKEYIDAIDGVAMDPDMRFGWNFFYKAIEDMQQKTEKRKNANRTRKK